MHPVTAAMLVGLGLFPTKNKALKTAQPARALQRIRLVGTVCQKAGRPENVYARWTPKVDHLLHEVQLTQMCFRLDAEKILRGPHVTDAEILPDAEVWINGEEYYLEWDRGSMSYGQIVARSLLEVRELPGPDALGLPPRRSAARVCAFAPSEFAPSPSSRLPPKGSASPHREIRVYYHGEKATLPRQKEGEENRG